MNIFFLFFSTAAASWPKSYLRHVAIITVFWPFVVGVVSLWVDWVDFFMCLRIFDLFFHFLFFHRQQQNCRKWDFGRLESCRKWKKTKKLHVHGVWSWPCGARHAPGYTDVLVVREIDCGDWLAREYMPAHQHCGLFYPLDCGVA